MINAVDREDGRFFDAYFEHKNERIYLAKFFKGNDYHEHLSTFDATEISMIRFLFADEHKMSSSTVDETFVGKFIEYLQSGRPHPSFNCVDFCSTLLGAFVRINDFPTSCLYEPCEEPDLRPFDAVTLLSASEAEVPVAAAAHPPCVLVHFAFYLGNETYLSVYGSGGGVFVTSLDEMRAFWQAKALFRVAKNTKAWP